MMLCSIVLLSACEQNPGTLPILGERSAKTQLINGKSVVDSIYHSIPNFSFTDQTGTTVTNDRFKNKIYVADFFFTSCPTICPVMKSQLLRVYEKFNSEKNLLLLSHTIDPEHDSVAVLRDYAQRLGVDSNRWLFVTGPKDSIYKIAESYMVSAQEDSKAPGGFVHSGALILLDKKQRIRGYYDGTDEKKVNQLMEDIAILLNEN